MARPRSEAQRLARELAGIPRQWWSSQTDSPPNLRRHYRARTWQLHMPPEDGLRALDYDDGGGHETGAASRLVMVSTAWVEAEVEGLRETDGSGPAADALEVAVQQAHLSPRELQVFRLQAKHPDWTPGRLARRLRMKPGAMRMALHRARRRLAPHLHPEQTAKARRRRGRGGRYSLGM